MSVYSPLYPIGSKVISNDSNQSVGEVVKVTLEATFDENTQDIKITYLVQMEGGNVRKFDEKRLKRFDTTTMDEFLADMLLLSRDSNPKVVDQTIKELLNIEGEPAE